MINQRLDVRFVTSVPRVLEPGVLYISMEYGTAVHGCCCGCGEQVVTPFSPDGWKMTFDGESVTIRPSIGNWNFKCRSHYFITESRAVEVGTVVIAPQRSQPQVPNSVLLSEERVACEAWVVKRFVRNLMKRLKGGDS